MKNYVIDTNVLIQAPNALWAFQENRIVIPLVVVEELDHLKKQKEKKRLPQKKRRSLLQKKKPKPLLLKQP